jgi:hypothetical protein
MAKLKEKRIKYYLNSSGEFVIENYNLAKPFANFFPGIAGKYGIPMWLFYVNRAQGISSFGTKDKDHSILEFFSANKAWQLASTQGFRTFIKIFGKNTIFYEPFQNGLTNLGFNLTNRMFISSYGLALEEENLTLGLKIRIDYFNIPNDTYAGLARILTLKNLNRLPKKIQLLDGLPQIVPFGTNNFFLKKMSRTIEAWFNVENLDKGVPFYKLGVDPKDTPEVIHIKEGNFYLGFHFENKRPVIIKPLVNPEYIFGRICDFSLPAEFLAQDDFKSPKRQIIKSQTPSAFLLLDLRLSSLEEKTLYSVIGHMRSREILNAHIPKIISPGYLMQKKQENKLIIEELQQDISTVSSSREFNLYAQQTYLDNILRGGYPTRFKSGTVFYLYLRKHGDLERDYNKFQIQPSYFSQGNGNYRDINQNRRCDNWFHPEIGDENIITFLNLIQADGFNPLILKGISFILKDEPALKDKLKECLLENQISKIILLLNKPFTPGEVILFLQDNKIELDISFDEFLNIILSFSTKIQEAEHAEGFWIDHWHYNLDLIDSYLAIYPEKLKELFFDKKVFTFYDNAETVRPRSEKYILMDNAAKQLHSLHPDNIKKEMIKKRQIQPHVVRTQYGLGQVYQTTLINKLLCLLVNKLSSLDPLGIGIEMEADKPDWFDALNGLPALFGSTSCETFELKRLVVLLKGILEKTRVKKIYITEEIYYFLIGLNNLVKECINSKNLDKDFRYWDKSYSLREDYRYKTRFGFSGKELEMGSDELIDVLNNALEKINMGLNKARDEMRNVYYAYFINEVKEFQIIKDHFVMPAKFIQKRLPLFLAGQMHALRLAKDIKEAKLLYKATKKTELFDRKLKMYKVTASFSNQPLEIGRCRAFMPGWLENESIWLHMEYKYLLEVLKQGLYEEFYEDFKNVLIPFQKPQRYGRSILENSSFLVSSAFPDKNLHGNGFVARLSGSTAEFLQIWLLMNIGKEPFFLNEQGYLNLKFSPKLAGWLFNKNGTYGFNFLSKTSIVYHNAKRKNAFGKDGAKIKRMLFNDKDGRHLEISSDIIPAPYAEQIRSGLINQINIYFE